MALIKCPKCKSDVSDRCEICPKCGASIAPNDNTRVCPECGNRVEMDAKQCNNCGFPFDLENKTKPKSAQSISVDVVIAILLFISCVMLLPEICYNRVAVKIATQNISQVRGESFSFAAEAASKGLRNLTIVAGFIASLLQFNRKKFSILSTIVSTTYLASLLIAAYLIEDVVEISASGQGAVVYSRTSFMYIVIAIATVTVIYDIITKVKKRLNKKG